MDQSIDVVLPCLDEAAALPGVLSRLPLGYRAIVVDNGSTDGTAEVAAAHGAVVVPEPQRGYGAAVQAPAEDAVTVAGDVPTGRFAAAVTAALAPAGVRDADRAELGRGVR